jgi:hypothetical protein
VLARSLPYSGGRHTLADLEQEILDQNKNLWTVFEAGRQELKVEGAFLTSIGQYPSLRVLRIDFLAGDNLRDWIHDAERALKRYAWENECRRLEMAGRIGWWPVLERLGWKTVSMTLEKDVHEQFQGIDAADGAECNDSEHSVLPAAEL